MGIKQELFTSLSCDPYSLTCFSGNEKKLLQEHKLKYDKNRKTLAFLATNAFITTQVSISSNIEEEDLYDIIENAAYEELGLDIATEYKISYFERTASKNDSSRLFEVFIAEPQVLAETFGELLKQVRYLDEIIPQPLLLQALYLKELITNDKTDVFVYFTDHDAFLTFYREGEFLYTKDLNSSLDSLYEHYCQICGNRIEKEEFLQLFTQTGLRTQDEEEKSFLIKLITQIVTQVHEILNFAKRTFEISAIDRIYFGTSSGPIHGIDEFSQTILGIESLNFDFDYGYEKSSPYIDQLHHLLHLTALIPPKERYRCNLTIFPSPPPLLERESGRLLAIAGVSLALSLAFPLYNLGYSAFASLTLGSLEKQQRALHQQRLQREHAINELIVKRKALEEKKKDALETQVAQKNVLNKIYMKKVQYPMKAKIIADLTQDLNTYNVQLMQIEYENTPKDDHHTFLLKMTAPNEKNMTTMIEKLTRQNLQNYATTIQEIVYNDKLGLYQCDLKIELKLKILDLESRLGS